MGFTSIQKGLILCNLVIKGLGNHSQGDNGALTLSQITEYRVNPLTSEVDWCLQSVLYNIPESDDFQLVINVKGYT